MYPKEDLLAISPIWSAALNYRSKASRRKKSCFQRKIFLSSRTRDLLCFRAKFLSLSKLREDRFRAVIYRFRGHLRRGA